MAKKKKAATPFDESGILKPRWKMTPEEVTAANKVDPTPPPKQKRVPKSGVKEYKEPVQKRPKMKPAPKTFTVEDKLNNDEEKVIRAGTNAELRKGIPTVVIRDQKKPAISSGPNLPRIGQIYKHSDGRIMRVSAENINEVHSDAKRTVLPTAGREEMMPERPAPLPGPRGGLKIKVTKNTSGNRSGLGVAHDIVKDHVDRALGHLDTMASTEHGSGPYRQAKKSFSVVHKAIGDQNMSKPIHGMLQLAHNHIDTKQKGTDRMLGALKEAVGAKLREGKLAEEERTFRQYKSEKGGK